MCGRFTLRTPRARLEELFALPDAPANLSPRFNIAPSQPIASIRQCDGQREWVYFKWGLVPSWSRQAKPPYSTINARAETVARKPAFRKAFRQSRCLIPADGFYEWKADGNRRQPYLIHRKDDAPFAFAGIWDHWQSAEQVIESAAIIVTEPNEVMAAIHNRMPVILDPEDYALWLDHNQPLQRIQDLLRPSPDGDLEAYPVSRLVNAPANDGPACIEPQTDLFPTPR
jgi:putative SOS response-associated peptidase YedK